jgi:hypothetical protein
MRCVFFVVVVTTSFLISCGDLSKKSEKESRASNEQHLVSADTALTVAVDENLVLQLLKKNELTEHDLYTDLDGGSQLSDYFLIELIDKETFNKNKSTAVNLLVVDTTTIRKEKGVLTLPCLKKEVHFVDNLTSTDNHKEYSYVGQIDNLNVYLLSGIYWEDWDYFFVDKTTGKVVHKFLGEPYLSPDSKYIVSLDVDTFEGVAYIDLYQVGNMRRIDSVVSLYVKKWVPVATTEKMYWGNDNYLYVAVLHSKDFWAAEGNYAGLDQYIRLKPVA